MDIKCQNDSNCRYCMSRCDYCFQPATYGLFMEDSNGCLLQFCSDKCRDVACASRTSTRMHVIKLGASIPPHLKPRCAPIAPTHMKVAHLFIEATGEKLKEHEIALCLGDGAKGCPTGRMYVVYFSRTLRGQVALEFFVSETFEPEAPLPYLIPDKNVTDIIASLKTSGIIQKYLKLALPTMKKGYEEASGQVQGRTDSQVPDTIIIGPRTYKILSYVVS